MNVTLTPEKLAELSGSKSVGGGSFTPASYFNKITLGKNGHYYLDEYSVPKAERPDPTDLTEKVTITIIKLRAKWQKWVDNSIVLESAQYDAEHPINTTEGVKTEAELKALKAKKTIVLYVILNGKLATLEVSGGSLYNPDDLEDLRFYNYLTSLGDDHVFQFQTELGVKQNSWTPEGETEPKVSNQMTFKNVGPSDLNIVGTELEALVAQLVINDETEVKFLGKKEVSSTGTSTGEGSTEGSTEDAW